MGAGWTKVVFQTGVYSGKSESGESAQLQSSGKGIARPREEPSQTEQLTYEPKYLEPEN